VSDFFLSAASEKSDKIVLLFLISVSFLGLILTVFFTISPLVSKADFEWRKPLVGSVFTLICAMGSLAAFFPNQCSGGLSFGKDEKRGSSLSFSFNRSSNRPKGGFAVLRGHHPTCKCYSSHVFHMGRRVFCATCSGLFLGALLALLGIALYFFVNWSIGSSFYWIEWVGLFGVILGLSQPFVKLQRSSVRVFSGAFLALGALMILLIVDALAQSLLLDFFVIFLSVFWLVTRISLSHWEHQRICSACSSDSCDVGS
jgi:hypothetical protein